MSDNSSNENLQRLLSEWQRRAIEAESKAAELQEEINRRKTIFSSTPVKVFIAVSISLIVVFLLVFFFIKLADSVTDTSIPEGDIPAILQQFDGSEWQTDKDGIESFGEVFNIGIDGSLRIEKRRENTAAFIFSAAIIPVRAYEGIFCGILNGVRFTVQFSSSSTGEGEAVSIISGETAIVFSPT